MSLTLALEMMWSGWDEVWKPIANHLWQSTLFAGLAGLLALALEKNHAATRYWVWFVSSVKFLVPFSLLVALGSRFSWLHPADTGSEAILFVLGAPFSTGRQPANHPAVSSVAYLPVAFQTLWAIGCVGSWRIGGCAGGKRRGCLSRRQRQEMDAKLKFCAKRRWPRRSRREFC